MLSCGLPCLRRKGAQEKEGFHNIFEEKREGANRNRQDVTLKWLKKLQMKFEHF